MVFFPLWRQAGSSPCWQAQVLLGMNILLPKSLQVMFHINVGLSLWFELKNDASYFGFCKVNFSIDEFVLFPCLTWQDVRMKVESHPAKQRTCHDIEITLVPTWFVVEKVGVDVNWMGWRWPFFVADQVGFGSDVSRVVWLFKVNTLNTFTTYSVSKKRNGETSTWSIWYPPLKHETEQNDAI